MVEGRIPSNSLKRPISGGKTQPPNPDVLNMKLKMATALSADALAAAITSTTDSTGLRILLLDCRSFMDFDACHIGMSHNVYCPPIVKRRSGGNITLDNVIRCAATRTQLLQGDVDMVVVYDEDSETVDDVPSDSNASLVLRILRDEASVLQLYFLEGEKTFIHQFYNWPFKGNRRINFLFPQRETTNCGYACYISCPQQHKWSFGNFFYTAMVWNEKRAEQSSWTSFWRNVLARKKKKKNQERLSLLES